MNNYLISGLGADERAFKYLDLGNNKTHFIKWVEPLDKEESISNYAKRLAVNITAPNPVLIGLSFGGIMCSEIAKHIPVKKIILISSAKTKHEIPTYYRLAGGAGLQKVVPVKPLMNESLLFWLFGSDNPEVKQLIRDYIANASMSYIEWAIDKIITWEHSTPNPLISHIHGTADRILPVRYIKDYIPVKNGGHFMLMDQAGEVNRILKKLL